MRLSEAIMRDAALRPQMRGIYFGVQNMELCSCALGAAWEGCFGHTRLPDTVESGDDLVRAVTERDLSDYLVGHPMDDLGPDALCRVITHLNDYYTWPRERIAAWLSSLGL